MRSLLLPTTYPKTSNGYGWVGDNVRVAGFGIDLGKVVCRTFYLSVTTRDTRAAAASP